MLHDYSLMTMIVKGRVPGTAGVISATDPDRGSAGALNRVHIAPWHG
jgi:hypothetical protein